MNKKTLLLAGAATLLASTIAFPAFAEMTGTSTSTEPTHKATVPAADYVCVQTAVDARETAIASAFGTFTTAENAALAARKSALHDAWNMTTAKTRNTAVKKAWSDFRTANRVAYKDLRTAHKVAWKDFATASKACHAPVVEAHGEEGFGSLGL